MKTKLRQFYYHSLYRGMNVEILVAVLYKKDLVKILNLTTYQIKNKFKP